VSLKKVLIVDDSLAETRLIQSVLEQAGYWPVTLNDPTRLEQMHEMEQPGLILLDVVMPQRNGFQACRDLKRHEEFSRIPVVFVTSKNTSSDKFWAEQQGGDGFVGKPFTAQELIAEVRKFF
jgi:twitching motility two-component system response regulator PilH